MKKIRPLAKLWLGLLIFIVCPGAIVVSVATDFDNGAQQLKQRPSNVARDSSMKRSDEIIAEKAKHLFDKLRGPEATESKGLLIKTDFADDPEMFLILDASLDGKVSAQEFVEFYQRSRKRHFRRNIAYAENKAENRQTFNISMPIDDLSLNTDCFQDHYDSKVQRAIEKAPALPAILFFRVLWRICG
jgi:hypothetical protein